MIPPISGVVHQGFQPQSLKMLFCQLRFGPPKVIVRWWFTGGYLWAGSLLLFPQIFNRFFFQPDLLSSTMLFCLFSWSTSSSSSSFQPRLSISSRSKSSTGLLLFLPQALIRFCQFLIGRWASPLRPIIELLSGISFLLPQAFRELFCQILLSTVGASKWFDDGGSSSGKSYLWSSFKSIELSR